MPYLCGLWRFANAYAPLDNAAGIFVAEDMIYTVEDEASQIWMSGNSIVENPIWLDSGKSIRLTGKLGDNVQYSIYQQKGDFKLAEEGGNPAAIYENAEDMDAEKDGAKFQVYPYDKTVDFEADETLDHYSALGTDVTGSSKAGIYANFKELSVADLEYAFANAYGTDEDGVATYKYNGRSKTPGVTATAHYVLSKEEETGKETVKDIDATKDLTFKVEENDGSVGDVKVKVSSDSYHYTGETELTFRIVPFDLNDLDESMKEDAEFTVSDVECSTEDPDGTVYEAPVIGKVRLGGSMNWTSLLGAVSDPESGEMIGDFEVTYENNGKPGEATAVIKGINNYTGTIKKTFTIKATSGVLNGGNGNWYYYKDGKIQSQFNGFAKNENGWWYIEKGQVRFDKTDVMQGTVNGENAWWYVKGGKVTFTDTVASNSSGWWKITNGKVDFGYNGVAQNANGWWKIENGKVNFKFRGFAQNEYGWWYLENGKVGFNKNEVIYGTVDGQTAWWYVKGSKVTYTDTVASNANGWWKITNGKVDFGYTGVAQNANGWWRIENGKVNFSFNGLAQNEYGWWYIRGGKVDFGYNGYVNWNGGRYRISGGKVIS